MELRIREIILCITPKSEIPQQLNKKEAPRELISSQCFFEWLRTESNRRHKDFQSFALPTELLSRN